MYFRRCAPEHVVKLLTQAPLAVQEPNSKNRHRRGRCSGEIGGRYWRQGSTPCWGAPPEHVVKLLTPTSFMEVDVLTFLYDCYDCEPVTDWDIRSIVAMTGVFVLAWLVIRWAEKD